jgi:hypothetical protein
MEAGAVQEEKASDPATSQNKIPAKQNKIPAKMGRSRIPHSTANARSRASGKSGSEA